MCDGCITAEAPAPVSTPAPGAFKQCGGLNGGGCEKNKTCADAQWKSNTCPTGFKCYRANKYYWCASLSTLHIALCFQSV